MNLIKAILGPVFTIRPMNAIIDETIPHFKAAHTDHAKRNACHVHKSCWFPKTDWDAPVGRPWALTRNLVRIFCIFSPSATYFYRANRDRKKAGPTDIRHRIDKPSRTRFTI